MKNKYEEMTDEGMAEEVEESKIDITVLEEESEQRRDRIRGIKETDNGYNSITRSRRGHNNNGRRHCYIPFVTAHTIFYSPVES